jgi:nucleoside-diphosphate-sugar epimerase
MANKILITGPLGHIGSKLIHNLKPGDYEEVVMIDNLSTQRYSSLFNLPKGVRYSFYEENILEADLHSLFRNIDKVIHFAAITDATSSFEKRDEVEEVNYLGTKKVVEACIAEGCKLIFPSTTSVYGDQKELVDEDCEKSELKPQSPYAETKLKSEEFISRMASKGKIEASIIRLGTIFGTSKGMRFHTAINKFCWQAVLGQPLTIWRTALDQKRPYLGLNDAVNCIDFFLNKELFDGGIYNVVTSNYTVKQVIDFIKYFIDDLQIDLVDNKIMNQLSYEVSTDKIESLGFVFKDNLGDGIEQTISLLSNSNLASEKNN